MRSWVDGRCWALRSCLLSSGLVPGLTQTFHYVTLQVTAVTYPAPRALAPPGAFNPAATPSNLATIAPNLQTNIQNNIASSSNNQQPQKQRVFTGTITKLCADFGFVDEDVFFQTR